MKKTFLTIMLLFGILMMCACSKSVTENVTNSKNSTTEQISTKNEVNLLILNNGAEVPSIGLGTQDHKLELDDSNEGRVKYNDNVEKVVSYALKNGYRHIDTAHGYNNEDGVRRGIIASGVSRKEIWLTSKLWPNEFGEGITYEAINKMLKRLGVDYIDCLYLHHPVGDYVGAWKDMIKAYKEGKVKSLGISNFDNNITAWNAIVNGDFEIKPQITQIELHPFAQRKETRELAKKNGIQVECWYPLANADSELFNNETLVKIAKDHNKTVPQVILRFENQEGLSIVPGSTNEKHIIENISIFDFELTESEMNEIRALDKGEEGRKFNIDYTIPQIAEMFMNTTFYEPNEDGNNVDEKSNNTNMNGSKNLVIYFDYSENIDTAGLTVDAISSASLSNGSTGKNLLNLKVMVDEIQNKRNADVFSIQVNEVYPPMFDDMVGMAQTDQNQNKQFTFKNELTNLSDYDTVYFGVPVWWAKLPQPVSVFFEKYDFSGKTIIPFGIHHGSRFGRMIQQMKDYEKDANILDGFTIDADTSNEDVRKEFDKFLEKIN